MSNRWRATRPLNVSADKRQRNLKSHQNTTDIWQPAKWMDAQAASTGQINGWRTCADVWCAEGCSRCSLLSLWVNDDRLNIFRFFSLPPLFANMSFHQKRESLVVSMSFFYSRNSQKFVKNLYCTILSLYYEIPRLYPKIMSRNSKFISRNSVFTSCNSEQGSEPVQGTKT